MQKNQFSGVIIMLILVLALFGASLFADKEESIKNISYSELINLVNKQEIASVTLIGENAEAKPKKVDEKNKIALYKTVVPYNDLNFISKLEKQNVDINVKSKANSELFPGLVGPIVVLLAFLLLIMLFFKTMQSGASQAMSFLKSKARLNMDNKVKITFKDVAGIDEERQELEEIVDFLMNGEKYVSLGAKIPKGVLLIGPPGTGKTLMAKAVAGEAKVPFFSISGSDFVELYVGVGASRVRDLFEQAKKHAPCIVFIDEIDAVGRQRGAGMGGGHDEREQTLNQLLVEMDGFDENTNIIVIAATNRPDILDNALLRPGRFDRQIVVNTPDVKGREEILRVHAKNKPLTEDVDLKVLAKRTPGFTGADLQNLLNEAALYAARLGKKEISMAEIDVSIDKVIAGIEKKSKVMTDEDKEIIAYHEVGHALLLKLLKTDEVLHKVSIIPRGFALGLTWHKPKDESVFVKKSAFISRIAMALGGRAAEEIIFGKDSITTGASNDLQKSTETARKMVTQWGMSEKLGTITYGKSEDNVFMGRDFGHLKDYSEEIAAQVDEEVKRIITEQYEKAKKLLTENRDIMEAIVKVLLEKETLEEAEVDEIIKETVNNRSEN